MIEGEKGYIRTCVFVRERETLIADDTHARYPDWSNDTINQRLSHQNIIIIISKFSTVHKNNEIRH